MFRLCLSNRKKMRKSATDTGKPGDLTVNLHARALDRRDQRLANECYLKVEK